MIGGFMAGVALGQQLVGAGRKSFKATAMRESATVEAARRMRAAKLKAAERMEAKKRLERLKNNKNREALKEIQEEAVLDKVLEYEFRDDFKDDSSGHLLNSIRKSIKEFNYWIRRKTGGLLDLNMSLAIFFIIRGIRKFVIEKQYPSAWQLIWWASSIMRGWRFM